jgi:hypothetical protein
MVYRRSNAEEVHVCGTSPSVSREHDNDESGVRHQGIGQYWRGDYDGVLSIGVSVLCSRGQGHEAAVSVSW